MNWGKIGAALSRAGTVARSHRSMVRMGAVAIVTSLALVDRAVRANAALGFLYLIPITVCAFALSRTELVFLGLVCSVLREHYSPFAWEPGWLARLEAVSFAFITTGLLVLEIERGWSAAEQYARNLAHESELRERAEEQTRTVLATCPLAVLAVEGSHRILLANESARVLFGAEEVMVGQDIRSYLPQLSSLLDPSDRAGSRTMIETRGLRSDGQAFLAQVWCSASDKPESQGRFTLVVWDASDSLRDREEAGLEAFLTTSRIVVGAVSHEIRNMAAASSVALANLGKDPQLAGRQDYQALTTLIDALQEMARFGLRTPNRQSQSASDLSAVLEELRLVIEPLADEAGVTLVWCLETPLPRVRAEHVGLLQVFLNLAKNSMQALADQPDKRELRIEATAAEGMAIIDIRDSGPGVKDPENLFRPFQPGASHSGLGLYVSRATVRSFAGELTCKPSPAGAWFQVKLARAEGRHAIA